MEINYFDVNEGAASNSYRVSDGHNGRYVAYALANSLLVSLYLILSHTRTAAGRRMIERAIMNPPTNDEASMA